MQELRYLIFTDTVGFEDALFVDFDKAQQRVRELKQLAGYRNLHVTIRTIGVGDLFEVSNPT